MKTSKKPINKLYAKNMIEYKKITFISVSEFYLAYIVEQNNQKNDHKSALHRLENNTPATHQVNDDT